jgi:glucose-6-phosphate-specific signal transduction histidine kinase
MSNFSKRLLFWTPRILSIACIAFLCVFMIGAAADEHLGFRKTMQIMIPIPVLIAGLILAWRWEWIGAVLFAVVGLFLIVANVSLPRPLPFLMKLVLSLITGGPVLVISGLFLANWLKRGELHTRAR